MSRITVSVIFLYKPFGVMGWWALCTSLLRRRIPSRLLSDAGKPSTGSVTFYVTGWNSFYQTCGRVLFIAMSVVIAVVGHTNLSLD
jgi:hypothetical protein